LWGILNMFIIIFPAPKVPMVWLKGQHHVIAAAASER